MPCVSCDAANVAASGLPQVTPCNFGRHEQDQLRRLTELTQAHGSTRLERQSILASRQSLRGRTRRDPSSRSSGFDATNTDLVPLLRGRRRSVELKGRLVAATFVTTHVGE